MAIGFSLPGIPSQIRGTAEEAGAAPDLGQAMMQGFRSNIENVQGAPRLLSQKLLSNALSNKIKGVQAKYAEPMAKTSYDQALANLQHQGLINQYYGRMRESELASAGLSQAHQRLINQYYGRIQESNLRGQGLTQTHQQMVNAMLKRKLDRQKRYDELLEEYRKQGASPEQAHDLALQTVNQTHPVQEQQQLEQPQQDLAQTILGAQMPDYLANIAPQEPAAQADIVGQNVPYSPMGQPDIGMRYTPVEYGKSEQKNQENLLKKILRKNNEIRDAGLRAAFEKPYRYALEQQLKKYPNDPNIEAALARLDYTQQPPISEVTADAQGYQGISPMQTPELQQQQAMAQAFQTPPSPQAAPEYLQRPEEQAQAMQQQAVMAQQAQEQAQQQPAMAQQQAMAQQAPQSYAEQLQQAGYNTANANPAYAAEDQLYLQNPNYRDLLKEQFPNIGTKLYNDFPRNRQIITDTLPSGATKTTIQSLGGGEGGGALPYKASSPYGKAVEDLKHYVQIGDLQSAEGAKKYVDSLLDREGKTQTGFNKAYNEWENAAKEFGPDSPKAQKFNARLQSLIRGNQTIQLNKGFPITNPETGEQGYAYPQTKDEKLITGGRAAFNYIYPILEEGVKPFSGTILQTTTALANAVKNQNVDKNAAKQLENFLLADKIRQSGGIKELRLIGGGMFKKTLEAITNTLANDQIQEDIKNFTKKNLINRDIQTRVNERFRKVLNGMSDAELKASSEYIPIYPSQVGLKDNITHGLKKSASQKINQAKPKAAESDVIVVTPEMVKGLRG